MSYSVSCGTFVTCPACGNDEDLVDYMIDGHLQAGKRFECTSCNREVLIETVNWEPMVTCRVWPGVARMRVL